MVETLKSWLLVVDVGICVCFSSLHVVWIFSVYGYIHNSDPYILQQISARFKILCAFK